MQAMLNIAVRAARRAGSIITRSLDRLDALAVAEKGKNDFVSEVDQKAEADIIETIRRSYPDHAVLGEETGSRGKNDFTWIIDPLDGTTNFLHGFPQFAVSIGVRYRDRMEHGVVYDPMRDELFTASRGHGAKLNDRRLRVSKTKTLARSLIGTGFPFREFEQLDEYMSIFRTLMTQTSGIRRPGSAALDLAYVASGRLDGFWEFNLNAWDIAAGTLLIQEAGGIVTDMRGKNDFLENGDVIAGTPKIHQELVKIINPKG